MISHHPSCRSALVASFSSRGILFDIACFLFSLFFLAVFFWCLVREGEIETVVIDLMRDTVDEENTWKEGKAW